ncbi:FKBP-type peptidyl-prolyl cis-trans isomerase [Pendulispora albinea]|uniref:Peptidyl-prolyl cis-trans isomerase n=2 Tax=Pendulispora albinea TaxID=2741071 RepID=A0ABZ2MCQ4_9BACT
MSDLRPGDGKEARRGDTVRVHYVGTLADGTEFDSSRRRDTPLEFQLGTNAVIKGFDTAIVGMKLGGLRRVTIPPELGYGAKGSPPKIPANATLVFEIELVDIVND